MTLNDMQCGDQYKEQIVWPAFFILVATRNNSYAYSVDYLKMLYDHLCDQEVYSPAGTGLFVIGLMIFEIISLMIILPSLRGLNYNSDQHKLRTKRIFSIVSLFLISMGVWAYSETKYEITRVNALPVV